jgi:hypothetical protein
VEETMQTWVTKNCVATRDKSLLNSFISCNSTNFFCNFNILEL